MFINVSNHPITKWGRKQQEDALHINCGAMTDNALIDLGFPTINPHWDIGELLECVLKWKEKILLTKATNESGFLKNDKVTIHLMGETGFISLLGLELWKNGFNVVHSTTERKVVEKDNGEKISVFEFIQFRKSF
jgi:hypothetical protein